VLVNEVEGLRYPPDANPHCNTTCNINRRTEGNLTQSKDVIELLKADNKKEVQKQVAKSRI
jgi:hypothetical protein